MNLVKGEVRKMYMNDSVIAFCTSDVSDHVWGHLKFEVDAVVHRIWSYIKYG